MHSAVREKAPVVAACAGVAAVLAFSTPASLHLGSALFLGKTILLSNGLPSVLGDGSFTAPHDRWFGVGWLTALIASSLYAWGGYLALIFGSTVTAMLAFLLVERRCAARGLGSGATALALTIAGVMSLGNLRVGNGIADLAFAAAFLYAIERSGKAAWWGALLLAVLWCNASPTGLIVPLIVEFVRRSAVSTAFFFVLLATPAGARLLTHATAYLRVDGMNDISTWQPMRVSPVAFIAGFLPATILAGWIGLLRAGKGDVGVTLCALLLAQMNGYYLGVAGIIVGPIIATALERFLQGEVKPELPESVQPALPTKPAKGTKALKAAKQAALEAARVSSRRMCADAAWCAGLLFLPALLALSIAHARGVQAMDDARDSEAAAQALLSDGHPHRVYCANPDWCNAVLSHGKSSVRVFLDGRRVDYPDEVRHASDVIAFMDPNWRDLLEKWKIDAIEAPNSGLGELLTVLPGWRCVYSSDRIRLFERQL